MKSKKITSLILAFCMLVSMFSFSVFALEGIESAEVVYKASDAWYASDVEDDTNNTYNGNTVWTWERSDNNVRQSLAYYCRLRMGFAMNPKDTGEGKRYSGPAWTTQSAEGTHPAVGEGWMKPYASKTETQWAVSRNFTAPVTGTYEFSTEDGYIYGGSLNPGAAGHRTAFIQITKQNLSGNITRIWPSDAAIRIPETATQDYKFEPVQFNVKKGEIIRFVVFNGNDEGTVADETGNTYCAGKYVYWKPVATLLKSYSSDEAWPSDLTNTTTISNNDEIWKFKYSTDSGATYVDFSQSAGNNTHHYAQPVTTNGVVDYTTVQAAGNYTRVYADVNNRTNGVNNDATIILGKWWQAPSNTEESRVAKVFTAPYSGTIKISAKDESENAKIYVRNNKRENTAGPKLYIDKKNLADNSITNIWNTAINHTSPSKDAITLTTYDFEAVTANVNAGDEIWFIVSGEQSANKQTKYVYWNPVVTYTDLPVNELEESTPAFTNTSNTALTTFADIISAGTVNVSLDVNTLNYTSQNAIMCVAVYNELGMLEDVALSNSTTIASNGKTTFTIDEMAVSTDLTGGFIKAFLFDSMDTLYPVSDIGATPIYTTLE